MAKLIVFSDLQAHTFKRFATLDEEGKNSRLQEAIKVLQYIRTLAQQEGICDILFCGDLFDAKGRTPVLAINAVYREFQRWSNEGLNVLMIPGNHDFAVRNGTEHALEVFAGLPGFTVLSKPSKEHWFLKQDTSSFKDTACFVVAVPSREEWDAEWFTYDPKQNVFPTAEYTICVGHGVVQGCTLDVAVTGQFGVLPNTWFEPYDMSFVGDVHDPQILRIPKEQRPSEESVILVPGCPWYQHPHENEQNRGVWIVDLDTKEMILKPVPGCVRFAFLALRKNGDIVQKVKDEVSAPLTAEQLKLAVDGRIVMLTKESIAIADHVLAEAKQRCFVVGAVEVEVVITDQAQEELMYAPRLDLSKYHTPVHVFQSVLYSGLVPTQGLDKGVLERYGVEILKEVL